MPKPNPAPADERDALCTFLDRERSALLRKIHGVSEADARRAPTASSLSLLSLLKHSATWERRWFQVIFAGREFPDEWPAVEEEDDADFVLTEQDTVESLTAYFNEQADAAREICASYDLGQRCAWPKLAEYNLRWVMLHMIEETARHAGHADIIRETLDGTRGL